MIEVRQRLEHESATYYSLPQLEKRDFCKVSRLPVSLRILLASVKKAAGKSTSTRSAKRIPPEKSSLRKARLS